MIKIYSDISADQDNTEIKEINCKLNDKVSDILQSNYFNYLCTQVEDDYFVFVSLDCNRKISGELCRVYSDFSESMICGLGKSFDKNTLTFKKLLDYSKSELKKCKLEFEKDLEIEK